MTSKRKLTDAGRSETQSIGQMQPGDVRIIDVKDAAGVVVKTLTLHRTRRAYAQDLCDAYNAANTRQDVEWIVDDAGGLRLVDRAGWTENHTRELERKAEADRRQWAHRQKYPAKDGA